jgi:hypothetical protein
LGRFPEGLGLDKLFEGKFWTAKSKSRSPTGMTTRKAKARPYADDPDGSKEEGWE